MSIGFDPPSTPPDGNAAQIVVGTYDSTSQQFSKLDFIRCERIEYSMGATPAAAQFSYLLDNSGANAGFPEGFEDLWPLGSTSKGLAVGTEILVYAVNDDETDVLFHGFVENPQINLNGSSQAGTFTAAHVSIRCWDRPVEGAVYREADRPQDGHTTKTALLARFNPDGHPNATPGGYDVDQGEDTSHPVFLDSRLIADPDQRRYWTLGMFARYLFQTREEDLDWVDNPDPHYEGYTIDDDLQAIYPAAGNSGPIDIEDETSYLAEDILVDDIIASDRPWPEVLETTLERHGFEMRFDTDQDDEDPPNPTHKVILSRKDGTFEPDPYDLYLQDGDVLDPAKTNIGQMSLMRDAHAIQNQFKIETKLNRYEVSFILAPLFAINSSDAADATALAQWTRQAIDDDDADSRKKYRWYGIDECAEGHWDYESSSFEISGLVLDDLFGAPDENGNTQYTIRRRPAVGDYLFSTDGSGRRRKVQLAISTNYTGACPDIWDGSGDWQDTGGAGWKLLRDRCGIEITCENPNGWALAKPTPSTSVIAGGHIIRGVEAQASPTDAIKRFYLRLTCVIESDKGLETTAERRAVSPSPFTVRRHIDGRDIYEKNVVHSSSTWAANETATPRDDTKLAQAQAYAFRTEHEFPRVTSRVVIPRLSLAYKVGDRIRKVIGKSIDFRSNSGAEAKESPRYPTVVGVTYDFSGGQTTTLELSDGDRAVDRRGYRQTNTEEES